MKVLYKFLLYNYYISFYKLKKKKKIKEREKQRKRIRSSNEK